MELDEKTIKRILEGYKDVFDALENYDKTGKLEKLNKKSGRNLFT